MASIKNSNSLDQIQHLVWQAQIPLEIALSPSESRHFDKTEPYLISVPRLSYLPLLLPRLQTYYTDSLIIDPKVSPPASAHFTHDGVPVKPHLPIGLLYDIHVLSTSDIDPSTSNITQHVIPLRLTLHFSTSTEPNLDPILPISIPSSSAVLRDAFMNSTKEADFLRSGSAKPIMSLNAIDSQNLWTSTASNDLSTFSRIFASLLPGAGTSATQMTWRNIPLRIYLPDTSLDSTELAEQNNSKGDEPGRSEQKQTSSRSQIRVLQAQVPSYVSGTGSASTSAATGSTISHARGQPQNVPQTLGMALHNLLPLLFPSRRTPILAKPILHGAVVPMNASLEDLASKACYADGWLNVVVAITA